MAQQSLCASSRAANDAGHLAATGNGRMVASHSPLARDKCWDICIICTASLASPAA